MRSTEWEECWKEGWVCIAHILTHCGILAVCDAEHNGAVMEFPIKSNRERSKLSQINMHVW